MKTVREYVIIIIIGALTGIAGGLAVKLIRGIQRIEALESQIHNLNPDGGARSP